MLSHRVKRACREVLLEEGPQHAGRSSESRIKRKWSEKKCTDILTQIISGWWVGVELVFTPSFVFIRVSSLRAGSVPHLRTTVPIRPPCSAL